MDEISNVIGQQAQMNVSETHRGIDNSVKQTPKVDLVKEIQESNIDTSIKINSKEDVEDLVAELNKAMAPMSTNLKFGVDLDDIFYVSVVESETSKMIRRFPAEQAASFLPKMQEVTGTLFDSKG